MLVHRPAWIYLRVNAQPPASFNLATEALVIGSGVLLIAAGAQIAIPFQPVPFTLQTLGVLLGAYVLGPVRAAIACTVYLALGVLGLPVFSGWSASSGSAFMEMKSGGFILGFIPAAFIAGYLADSRFKSGFWRLAAIGVLGHAVLLSVGMLWLARFIGFASALNFGVVPFIPGAIVKSLLAAGLFLMLDRMWKAKAVGVGSP